MTDAFVTALLVAACVLLTGALARVRPWWGALLGGTVTLGAPAIRDVMDLGWPTEVWVHDVPWSGIALVALLGAAPWLGTRLAPRLASPWTRLPSWPLVVIAAAFAGDLLVAGALCLLESDPRRRARLVLAASGASLAGMAGSAPLLLGHAHIQGLLLAGTLALPAFVLGRGTYAPASEPYRTASGRHALAFTAGAALVGAAANVAGTTELFATVMENLDFVHATTWRWHVVGAGLVGGALGDEGLYALVAREAFARALSLHGSDMVDTLRASLVVAGGLPLLYLTRSSWKAGLPVWLAQVGILAAWVGWS